MWRSVFVEGAPKGASSKEWLFYQAWCDARWPSRQSWTMPKHLRETLTEEEKMLRTYTIELRVNFNDDQKHEVMREAARMAAKHIMTTAELIADKSKVMIALYSSDFIESNQEISLADDIPGDTDTLAESGVSELPASGGPEADAEHGGDAAPEEDERDYTSNAA